MTPPEQLALLRRAASALGGAILVADADGRLEAPDAAAQQRCPRARAGVLLDDALSGLSGVEILELGDRRVALLPSDAGEAMDRVATLSHEIRSPINTILGMADLLSVSELPEVESRYVRILQSAAATVLQLINNILDLQKLSAGRLELHDRPFYLHQVVDTVLESLALRAHDKGLELSGFVPPETPTYLVGDADRLQQALTNLVTNAVKFTETGSVTVRVVLEQEPATLLFFVEDTGPGVPPEKRDELFVPYVQVHAGGGEGTGLGLSISKRLAEALGGDLWYEAREGGGSRFCLRARFERQPSPERLTISFAAHAVGMRLLIVDDNEEVARAAAAVLQAWGPRPEIASDAEDALARIRAAERDGRPYDALLLDAELQPAGGFALARQVAELDPELVVIMLLDSRDLNRTVADAQAIGAPYLVKPLKREELFRTINRIRGEDSDDTLPPASNPSRTTRTARVLVVDDDETSRLFLQVALEREGHEVHSLGSAREGLSRFEAAGPFSLVLCDVEMPDMDGKAFARALRAHEASAALAATPLLAVTGHTGDGAIRACLDAGFTAHLSKPVSREALLSALSDHARVHAATAERTTAHDEALTEVRMAVVRRDYDAVTLVAQRLGADDDPAIAQIARRLAEAADERDRDLLRQLVSALDGALAPAGAPAYEIDDTIRHLIPRYLRRRRDDVEALRAALDAGDLTRVSFLGHRMGGTGSTYGFPDVTRVGKALEVAGMAGAEARCAELVDELAGYLDELPVELFRSG